MSKYQKHLDAYLDQEKTCPECGKVWTLRNWPVMPSNGQPKRTCCLTTGSNNKKKFEARKKEVNGETWLLCNTCKKHKPFDQFYKSKGHPQSKCKQCHSEKYADYEAPSTRKAREEARKRRILRENEVLQCKVCGKKLKRKDWPKQKSGRPADSCCSHRTAAHVNRYLMKRGKRLCGTCDLIKPLDHFPQWNGKARSPCKLCLKVSASVISTRQRRQDRIVESDDGTLTPEAIKGLFSSQKSCIVCFKPMKWEEKTLDHVLPLSKDGAHSIKNAMVMCHKCNSKKRESLPRDWFESLPEASKESVMRYFEQSEHLDESILQ